MTTEEIIKLFESYNEKSKVHHRKEGNACLHDDEDDWPWVHGIENPFQVICDFLTHDSRYYRYRNFLIKHMETGKHFITTGGECWGGDDEFRGFHGSIRLASDEEVKIIQGWIDFIKTHWGD